MDKKKYARSILDKYGEEKGRDLLQKLMSLEKVGGSGFKEEALEKLNKNLDKADYNEPTVKKSISKVRLDKDSDNLLVKGEIPEDNSIHRIKGSKEASKSVQRLTPGKTFNKKIASLRALAKASKKGLKAIPMVGGLVAGLLSGDASAAIPILGDSDPLGPQKGDEGYDIENPPSKKKGKFKRLFNE